MRKWKTCRSPRLNLMEHIVYFEGLIAKLLFKRFTDLVSSAVLLSFGTFSLHISTKLELLSPAVTIDSLSFRS